MEWITADAEVWVGGNSPIHSSALTRRSVRWAAGASSQGYGSCWGLNSEPSSASSHSTSARQRLLVQLQANIQRTKSSFQSLGINSKPTSFFWLQEQGIQFYHLPGCIITIAADRKPPATISGFWKYHIWTSDSQFFSLKIQEIPYLPHADRRQCPAH